MPAAIYGRLSVEDEETEESMETQIALVQDYINRSRELSCAWIPTRTMDLRNKFLAGLHLPALMNDVRQKKIMHRGERPLTLWPQLSGSRILYRNSVPIFGRSTDCRYR